MLVLPGRRGEVGAPNSKQDQPRSSQGGDIFYKGQRQGSSGTEERTEERGRGGNGLAGVQEWREAISHECYQYSLGT